MLKERKHINCHFVSYPKQKKKQNKKKQGLKLHLLDIFLSGWAD